jgi:hypothetical protein
MTPRYAWVCSCGRAGEEHRAVRAAIEQLSAHVAEQPDRNTHHTIVMRRMGTGQTQIWEPYLCLLLSGLR